MKLSILIAAYNVADYIEKCVKSCYDPRFKEDYEIIVVNDGSTDATLEKLYQLELEIPNIKIINQKNCGLGASRNTGIENASGEYIWMIDGDDFLTSDAIEIVLKHLESQSDVYAGNYNITDDKGTVLSQKHTENFNKEILSGFEYYSANYNYSYTWKYIFSKALFIVNDIRFKEKINMQDSEIMPKLMFHAQSVQYIDHVIYNYVQQDTSFTNTNNPQKRINYFKSILIVDQSLKDFGESIKKEQPVLFDTIQIKRKSLHQVIFNHLVYFKYEKNTLKTILSMLKENGFYPLQYSAKGKMRVIKALLNTTPYFTKNFLEKLR